MGYQCAVVFDSSVSRAAMQAALDSIRFAGRPHAEVEDEASPESLFGEIEGVDDQESFVFWQVGRSKHSVRMTGRMIRELAVRLPWDITVVWEYDLLLARRVDGNWVIDADDWPVIHDILTGGAPA